MNKILKFIFPKLFLSEKERNGITRDLKTNPDFRSKDASLTREIKSKLEKGEIRSIFIPDFGNQNDFKITRWYFKNGDVIKPGDVICDLENKHLAMECESIYAGKLIAPCETKEVLRTGMEICKVEGI